LGSFLRAYQLLLRLIGGIVLVIFGLHLTGILRLPIFYWQKRFAFRPSRPSYPASLLIGVIFAIGWTPCVGLILGPILGLAANAATLQQGPTLLVFYSFGLGLPFLLLGLGLDQLSTVLKWLKPHVGKIAQRRTEGILAVEMEAAALYALAQARQYQIICFAHVTNQMGQTEGDFEKGEASGSETALSVVGQTARSWRHRPTEPTRPV
jgi:cytochrome c biogenesis protein CcdA